MANVSKLLDKSPQRDSYIFQLEPTDAEKAILRDARDKIRNALRSAFVKLMREQGIKEFTPKFYTQGSYAYGTLNRGERMPPQQMDLDDGTYLPLSFAEESATRPKIASAMFFAAADAALDELVEKEEGWKSDKTKDTCCRVIISKTMHIDLPLYALPDDQFSQMLAVASTRMLKSADLTEDIPFMNFGRDGWELVPSDRVLLAHRKLGWKPSDPRKIHAWFKDFIATYGEIGRRVCRYLKGWRDHDDKLNGVSSLALMAVTYNAFKEVGVDFVPEREDEAVALVASKLSKALSGTLPNPTDTSEDLNRKLTPENRPIVVAAAQKLSDEMYSIIHFCKDRQLAVDKMRDLFGHRIPPRPDLVSSETPVAAVKAVPAAPVPQRKVGATNSG